MFKDSARTSQKTLSASVIQTDQLKGNKRFVMSVRPSLHPTAWKNSASTGRIFMRMLRKSAKKTPVSLKPDKNSAYYT
jgi:hypothetical protein